MWIHIPVISTTVPEAINLVGIAALSCIVSNVMTMITLLVIKGRK
jgi:hypothetical protein